MLLFLAMKCFTKINLKRYTLNHFQKEDIHKFQSASKLCPVSVSADFSDYFSENLNLGCSKNSWILCFQEMKYAFTA